ncbi:MAG: hypothetical protein ABF242_04255 [Flavobacteriales bacterium]
MKKFYCILLLSALMTNCKERGTVNKKAAANIEQESETGKHIEKYPNGAIKIKGDMVKGQRQGLWESFYENGVKWSESTYLFGVRQGPYKIFYPDGKLKILGAYQNEEKSGIWYFYNEKGKFEKEIDFDEKQKDEAN